MQTGWDPFTCRVSRPPSEEQTDTGSLAHMHAAPYEASREHAADLPGYAKEAQ